MSLLDDFARAARGLRGVASGALGEAVRGTADWAEARVADAEIAARAELAKAQGKTGQDERGDPTHQPAEEPRALTFDPFDVVAAMGYKDRHSSMSYVTMDMVASTVPVVADIVRVRTTQVARFCKRPEDRHAPGFEVRLRDPDAKPTKKTDARCRELEEVLLHTGWVPPEQPGEYTPFQDFARMLVRDSLTFDQACFEVVPDRKGDPSYMQIVDPSTIRLYHPASRKGPDDPFAVQVVAGNLVADFTRDQLAFCVRNPRSGIRNVGYGESETETLIKEVTGLLWGIEYNRRFFSQGSSTKGILNFKGGSVPDKHLQAFRRQWYAMVSGVNNAWRTPIVNAEDLQWISLQMTNKDMEFSAWMDWLIKVACARFLIAPEEINFSYGNTGQSQAMGQAPIEEKLQASRDLGLRPLIEWTFEQVNEYFLRRIDPDYEAVPVGLDARGLDAETSSLKERTAVYMTIDEARQEAGLEPLGDEKGGDVIRDPTWLQRVQGLEGMGEEDPDGGFGDPGEDSGGGWDDDASADDFEIDDGDDGPGVDEGSGDVLKSVRHTVRLEAAL